MRVNRFRLVRFGALAALVALAVTTGFAANVQAASVAANKPLLVSDHTAQGNYEAIRYGQNHSTAAYLAEYNKAQAMKSASSLPGTVYREGSAAASPSIAGLPGGRWTAIGPTALDTNQGNPFYIGQTGPNSGRGVTILVDTNTTGANTVLYEAASGGGVWKSINNGASWTPTTDNMPVLQMGALAMDPNNHQTLYAGTGENDHCQGCGYGIGVYKTTNGGASWTILGGLTACTVAPFTNCNPFISTGTFTAKFNQMYVDPRNSDVLWTVGRNGLWKYTNSTSTWVQNTTLPGSPTAIQASDLAIDATTNPSTLYVANNAAFGGNAASGIFKSTDGGATWKDLTTAMLNSIPAGYNAGGINWNDRTLIARTALALAPSNHLVLYVAPSTPGNDVFGTDPNHPELGGLTFKTTDGGTTWTALYTPDAPDGALAPGFGQSWYDLYITVDPANANIVYFAGVDIDKTVNGGTSWTNITNVYQPYPSPVHPDQHFMTFVKPANGSSGPTQFYIANDGGIYTSPDGGITWTNLNSNLATLETYVTTEGANFTNQPLAWAGMQDNGSNKYTSNPVWANLFGGDGGFTAIDPTNQQNVYEEYVYLAIYKTGDGGFTWNSSTNGIPKALLGSKDYHMPEAAGALFIAPFILDPNAGYTTTTTYTPPSGGPTPNQKWNLHLLAGSDTIYETLDGASTWCPISPIFTAPAGQPGDGVSVSAIAVAASTSQPNAERIFAALANGQVWMTNNGFVSANAATTPGTPNCTATASWTEVDNGEITPGGGVHPYISGIAVDDVDPNAVYVTTSFGGRGASLSPGPHTFRSTGGVTTWVPMDGSISGSMLPNVNANDVVTYRVPTGNAIVVGTDLGVYFSVDLGTHWTAINNGLPNAIVNDLSIDFAHTTLVVSTKSRSVFAMPIPQLTPAQMGSGDTIGDFIPFTPAVTGVFELSNSLTTGNPDIIDFMGSTADTGVVGDWNGDNISTVGFFRPSLSQFVLKDSNAQSAPASYVFAFGTNTEIPVVGDWTGIGHKNVGAYNPTQGVFYLRNSLTTGFADEAVLFGPPNAIPIAGHWDGSGVDHIGVYFNGTFYLTTTSCALGTQCVGSLYKTIHFGTTGDLPVVGDWTHNGTTEVGVYRPSNGTFYLCLTQSCTNADIVTVWQGLAGSPVAGHFNNAGTPFVAAPSTVLVPGTKPGASTTGAQPANTGLGD